MMEQATAQFMERLKEVSDGQNRCLIAIDGRCGAGKTTLIKLLTRLYDPTQGQVLLDGVDIRRYDVAALYELYGIIFQDFGKYAFSVRENIAFGAIDRAVNQQAVQAAAQQAAAEPFILHLPQQYDTPLMRYFSEDGIELSVGQWQKLSVARAFYADSDILILDEPTASLDAIAEQEIFSQFDTLRRGKTTLFVSHRLSSATVADHIIVLDHGVLAEEGTHAELMARRGEYYRLFTTQAKRYQMQEEPKQTTENTPPPPPHGAATDAAGVQGKKRGVPRYSSPTFCAWKQSTSLPISIAESMSDSCRCFGSGSWTSMPSTPSSRFRNSMVSSSSDSDVYSGRRYSSEVIPASSHAFFLLRT